VMDRRRAPAFPAPMRGRVRVGAKARDLAFVLRR
jgi:hypothetical protein